MIFEKTKSKSDNILVLLKYILLILLIILTPITLFLTAFSWYANLQIRKLNNFEIVSSSLFFKNCLIFGIIGLISFFIYFLFFLLVAFALNRVTYKWKKVILISVIFFATIIFLIFEIFSIIFFKYYHNWQLLFVLSFWPLLYVVVALFLLVIYFEFYIDNREKNNSR